MLYCNVCCERNKQGDMIESKEKESSGKNGKQKHAEYIKVIGKTIGRRNRKLWDKLGHRTVIHFVTVWMGQGSSERIQEECSHRIER